MITKQTVLPSTGHRWTAHISGKEFNSEVSDADGIVFAWGLTPERALVVAAAPELLEALEEMLEAVPRDKQHPVGYTDSKQDKANDRARAAIAKARGQV